MPCSPSLVVRVGDCRELLREIPDESVQCCVTSPPYWGLRDYGHPDQIGQEPSPDEYVANLVSVFDEVRRVLRADGTLWLNLGDSYASTGRSEQKPSPKGTVGQAVKATGRKVIWGKDRHDNFAWTLPGGIKPKDLVGTPWMVAFALRDSGWWLRSEIIWQKPNVMPESVTDRPTTAHEKIFLLTKSASYYYDAEAIKEPAGNVTRNKRSVWTVPTAPYKEAHFATYPPDLIRPCIMAGTKRGDVVLDPFGGSGTTGQVALELGRRAILLELNADYAKIIEQRTNVTPGLALI